VPILQQMGIFATGMAIARANHRFGHSPSARLVRNPNPTRPTPPLLARSYGISPAQRGNFVSHTELVVSSREKTSPGPRTVHESSGLGVTAEPGKNLTS
jgi:hypothetical protein